MMWIIYFFIIGVIIIIPVVVVGIVKKPSDERYFFMSPYHSVCMKGVAIVLVICCHTMDVFGGDIVYFTPLGGIGVSIFLILSGYGINESWHKNQYHGFWRKRFISVIIPYFCIQLIAYWIKQPIDIQGFILDILCIKPRYGFGWYLTYLLMWYFAFYLVMRIPCLKKVKTLSLLIIAITLFVIMPELQAEQSMSFLTGVCLSEYKNISKRLNVKTVVFLCVFGIGFLAIKQTSIIRMAPHYVYNIVQLLIKLPIALGMIVGTYAFGKKMNLMGLYDLGIISYELYLVHGYILFNSKANLSGILLFLGETFVLAYVFAKINCGSRKIGEKLLELK